MATQSLRELAEDYQSRFAGDTYSVDTIPTTEVIEKQLIKFRPQAIATLFSDIKFRRNPRAIKYNDAWCFSVTLKKDNAEQPSFANLKFAYSRFPIPPVISINNEVDGYLSVSGTSSVEMYHRLPSGMEGWMNLNRKGDCVKKKYWWVHDGAICINDKTLIYPTIHACPEDPTQWVTWDYDTNAYVDRYDPDTEPFLVTANVLEVMDMYFKNYMNPLVPVDTEQNQITNQNEQRK